MPVATRPRFHLAFPVHDIEATRRFYTTLFGARVGRVDQATPPRWIDFDFFGHQLSAHLVAKPDIAGSSDIIARHADDKVDGHAEQAAGHQPNAEAHNAVDGDAVPCRHFGVILSMAAWRELVEHLKRTQIGPGERVQFLIEPKVRFAGQPGEQATLFLLDPSGNALEFKAFEDDAQVFSAT